MDRNKLLVVLVILLAVLRFLYVGCDLPGRCIGWFTQVDSFYYTSNAFDLFHSGNYVPEGIPFTPIRTTFDLFQKLITYLSLVVFGNHFFGFLFPPIFLSLLTIWITHKSLTLIHAEASRFNLFLILYLFTDFYFLLTSRVQSPVIYAAFGIALSFYLFVKFIKGNRNFLSAFLLGFSLLFTLLFLYVYAAFFIAAIGLCLLLDAWQTKRIVPLMQVAMGAFVSMLAFHLVLWTIADLTIFDFLHSLSLHGGGMKEESLSASTSVSQTFNLKSVVIKFTSPLISILATNIFRFNLGILVLFLASLIASLYALKLRWKDPLFLIFPLTFFLCYLQGMSGTFYFQRKLAMLLPIVLLFISSTFFRTSAILFKEKFSKRSILLLSVFIILTCSYVFWLTNSDFYGQGISVEEGGPNTSALFNLLNVISVLIALLLLFQHLNVFQASKRWIQFGCVLLLFPGIWLSMEYIYLNPKFKLRTALLEMNSITNGSQVVGGSPYQFSLYGNSTPKHASYLYYGDRPLYNDTYDRLCASGKVGYTPIYFYDKHMNVSVGDTFKSGKNYVVRIEKVYDLWEYGPDAALAKCILEKDKKN